MADGIQPQEDGRLACLECDGWYKLLAPHLAAAHSMTTAEYREAHLLPRKLSLRAADLAEQASAQGRARYADRPDIRANMAAGRDAINLEAMSAGSKATAEYELVRAARRRGGQGKRTAARMRADEHAQALGYPTIDDYLRARSGTPLARMARELGLSRSTVLTWLRHLEETDFLALLVGHLRAVVEGEAGNAQAAAWRARVPELAGLEDVLRKARPPGWRTPGA